MLKLENITKRFDNKAVLDSFSLTLNDGDHVAIMGESGAGKTTLLRIVAGLETADSGTVSHIEPSEIAYVFQEPRLFDHLSTLKNLTVVSSSPKKEAEEKAYTLLRRVGLHDAVAKRPRELSGGMKQRVNLARALMCDFKFLLLDEPFSALDEETKGEMITLVKEMTVGKTILFVTHDKDDAFSLCDNIVALNPSIQ